MKKILNNIVICSVIGLSSFSMQAQAASQQHISNTNYHGLSSVINYVSRWFPSPKTRIVENKHSTAKMSMAGRKRHAIVTLQKTAGASGMFRRVVNAPSAGGRLNPAKKLNASSTKGKMKLSANVPSAMGLQSKDYQWIIRSVDKRISTRKKGKTVSALLPPGKYNVRLTVGSTVLNKTVVLSSKGKKVAFSMSSGNLKASVSFAGGSSVKAKWDIYKLKGSSRGKKVYTTSSASRIKRALAPGKYEVVATVGRVVKRKTIRVSAGKTQVASLKLTGAKVQLLATKSDKRSPLMQKTKWVIKSVATNRTVLTKNRHSATVTLPPGKYVATATTTKGISRHKNFVVKPGRLNTIRLAME